MIYVGRKNGDAWYVAEHRLVAGRAIGRPLTTAEKVLHINNDALDNRPENLFVCASNSEMRKRVGGTLPWPTESNLSSYTAFNIQCEPSANSANSVPQPAPFFEQRST